MNVWEDLQNQPPTPGNWKDVAAALLIIVLLILVLVLL